MSNTGVREKKVLFLIRSLNTGGAERQMVVLAKSLKEQGCAIQVVVFYTGGIFENELRDAGIPVISLNKRGRWEILPFLFRLGRLVRRERPDFLHSYLPTANLAASLIKPFLPEGKLVWGVRASDMDLSRYDRTARFEFWLQSFLSRFADLVIVNSRRGLEFHREKGFPGRRMRLVPNGIDTERFRPDPQGREQLRREWDVGEGEILIGLVARIDPMKGHEIFLQAAARLAARRPAVRFVCVGEGGAPSANALQGLAGKLGLTDCLIWAGGREDMPTVYSAFDILTSASVFGEGFSNAIGEAMACGTPCVVTEVGDSSEIVGFTGLVVPPGDADALADGWEALLGKIEADRHGLSCAARCRIVEQFSETQLIRRTIAALTETC